MYVLPYVTTNVPMATSAPSVNASRARSSEGTITTGSGSTGGAAVEISAVATVMTWALWVPWCI